MSEKKENIIEKIFDIKYNYKTEKETEKGKMLKVVFKEKDSDIKVTLVIEAPPEAHPFRDIGEEYYKQDIEEMSLLVQIPKIKKKKQRKITDKL